MSESTVAFPRPLPAGGMLVLCPQGHDIALVAQTASMLGLTLLGHPRPSNAVRPDGFVSTISDTVRASDIILMDSAKTQEVPVTCAACGRSYLIHHREVWRVLGKGNRQLHLSE